MFLESALPRCLCGRLLVSLIPLSLVCSFAAATFDIQGISSVSHPLVQAQTCRTSDQSLAQSSSQWASTPVCHTASEADHGVPPILKLFCVYTTRDFANGRGLSIVTTPEVAISISTPSTPIQGTKSTRTILDGRPPSYEARQTHDRGIGLFANSSLITGATYMLHSPVLIISREALNSLPRLQIYGLLNLAVDRLPAGTQELYMALAKSKGADADAVDDVFQTNSMGVEVGGVRHLAVVPEAARINHACRPNSYYRFSAQTLTLDVFALKSINPGEELTFSYGHSLLPHPKRLTSLQRTWSFTCTCTLCSSPSAMISASDARLNRIEILSIVLPQTWDNFPLLLKLAHEMVELLEKEDLVVERPRYQEILAYAYSQLGKEEDTREWARQAREGWEVVAGKESWEARRMRELEGDVRGHGSW
ncbi:hypothetical protein BCR34DRAFT_508666, partial [Clohesyomyces aquaticus]